MRIVQSCMAKKWQGNRSITGVNRWVAEAVPHAQHLDCTADDIKTAIYP